MFGTAVKMYETAERTDEIAEGEAIMQQFLTHNPGYK
jgi:hypothetical protein